MFVENKNENIATERKAEAIKCGKVKLIEKKNKEWKRRVKAVDTKLWI